MCTFDPYAGFYVLSSGPLVEPCRESRRLRLRPVLFEPASECLACSSSRLGSDPLFNSRREEWRWSEQSIKSYPSSTSGDLLLGDRLILQTASPRVAHGAPLALLPLTPPRGLHGKTWEKTAIISFQWLRTCVANLPSFLLLPHYSSLAQNRKMESSCGRCEVSSMSESAQRVFFTLRGVDARGRGVIDVRLKRIVALIAII